MRRLGCGARCALVLLVCAGPAAADKAKPPAPPPAAKHLDFDDDKVEGDVQRADDPIVDGRNRARFGSLIKPRANFIAELLRSTDDL